MTIVIPAYNEAARLSRTLPRILDFVEHCDVPLDVIIVNNNSVDQTRQVAEHVTAGVEYVQVLDQPMRGKGAAIRKGVLAARGRYVFTCDADLAMPIAELPRFFPSAVKRGEDYDIAIGSREAPGARRYNEPAYRHVMGRVFNTLVRLLVVPGIKDTQCGFKSFRRDVARAVFSEQRINGWAFDVEVLALALHRGYTIHEIGISLYYDRGSKVNPIPDSFIMLYEVLRIRYNIRRGTYD